VLAAGVTAQASFSAIIFGVAVMAPALRSHYGIGLEETGLALAAPSLGSLLSLVAWGHLADRIGERPVSVAGLGTAAGALAGCAALPSFPVLIALLVAAGALGSSASAASGRAVMFWFERRRRGLALGIRQTAVPLGGLVASLAVAHLSLGEAFALLAAFCGVGAAASLLMRESPPPPPEEEIRSDRHPLRDRRMLRLLGASMLLIVGQVSATGFTVLYLHERHGLSVGVAAGILAGAQALGGALRIGAGYWSDRLGNRAGPLRVLSFALAAGLFLTAAVSAGPAGLAAAVILAAGALGMSWNGLSFTAATELSGHAQAGAAVGVQQSALNAAAAIAPIAFSAVVAAMTWGAAFGLAALAPLAAGWVLRRLSA
jgi:MFS family permease